MVDDGSNDGSKELAEASDVVFSIVGFPTDVREVILGKNGALAGVSAGNILVDMTTSEPSLAIEIADQAKRQDVASIDAPVSGGDVGAREATLAIMVGGDQATFDEERGFGFASFDPRKEEHVWQEGLIENATSTPAATRALTSVRV